MISDSRISSRGAQTQRSLIGSPEAGTRGSHKMLKPIDKPDKNKLVRNYLTKNIEVRPYLKAYRKSLDKKFGDLAQNGDNPDQGRDQKSAQQARDIKTSSQQNRSQLENKEESQKEEVVSKIDSNEIDSIIADSETDIREFTNDQNCMKGAPYPREITDLNDDYPVTRQSAEFLSNMSATKTKFNQTY